MVRNPRLTFWGRGLNNFPPKNVTENKEALHQVHRRLPRLPPPPPSPSTLLQPLCLL